MIALSTLGLLFARKTHWFSSTANSGGNFLESGIYALTHCLLMEDSEAISCALPALRKQFWIINKEKVTATKYLCCFSIYKFIVATTKFFS